MLLPISVSAQSTGDRAPSANVTVTNSIVRIQKVTVPKILRYSEVRCTNLVATPVYFGDANPAAITADLIVKPLCSDTAVCEATSLSFPVSQLYARVVGGDLVVNCIFITKGNPY